MLSEAQRHDLILHLERLPLSVEAAIRNLSDEQLDAPRCNGGWTIRQAIHHLADANVHAFACMKTTLTQETPSLGMVDQTRWLELADTRLPVQFSLWILRGTHERWVGLLRSLPREEWARRAMDPARGEVTLDDLLAASARFGRRLVEEIHDLRDREGW